MLLFAAIIIIALFLIDEVWSIKIGVFILYTATCCFIMTFFPPVVNSVMVGVVTYEIFYS